MRENRRECQMVKELIPEGILQGKESRNSIYLIRVLRLCAGWPRGRYNFEVTEKMCIYDQYLWSLKKLPTQHSTGLRTNYLVNSIKTQQWFRKLTLLCSSFLHSTPSISFPLSLLLTCTSTCLSISKHKQLLSNSKSKLRTVRKNLGEQSWQWTQTTFQQSLHTQARQDQERPPMWEPFCWAARYTGSRAVC